MKEHSHLLTMKQARELLFAGHALITVKSLSKALRFTFKVEQCKDRELKKPVDGLFFCSVLNGPDNWANYQYFGNIRINPEGRRNFTLGKKSKLSNGAASVKFFILFIRELYLNNLNGRVEIWHEGKCLKCGRRLTTPQSIERGIGPECWKKTIRI